jgi:hypothetical protein
MGEDHLASVQDAVEGDDPAARGKRRLFGQDHVGRNSPSPTIDRRQDAVASRVEAGWIRWYLQTGRPLVSSRPLRLIAIEILRSCGGDERSVVAICPPSVTATGAFPSRGRACGAILPSKETRRLPSWATSALAPATRVVSASAKAPALIHTLARRIPQMNFEGWKRQ